MKLNDDEAGLAYYSTTSLFVDANKPSNGSHGVGLNVLMGCC